MNTGLLYVRMLIIMAVSLYTSRVVLASLGAVDFGIYNVVGGIVVMLGFLNGTMSTASSRFITVALGKGDTNEMKSVFNTTLFVNCIFAIIVFVLAETVGLWFFHAKMEIPETRYNAAFVVYQLSVLTVFLNILCVAYNASIIAHERMKAFAYIGLLDAFSKLGIAFAVNYTNSLDKLVLYSLLMFGIQALDQIIYLCYCNRHFPETKFCFVFNKPLMRQLFSFIGWSSYGSFVSACFTQGLNILLNIFFGPIVNAARGISFQVQNAVNQFTQNFQTAINPQIIKSIANGDFQKSKALLIASSKFSFFLLCLLGIPIIAEINFILAIWLKEVPDYTAMFIRLMITISIFGCLANPLRTINQAEGHIKKFQLYECSVLLAIVPVSYLGLLLFKRPEIVFIVHLCIELIAQLIRVIIVLPKTNMAISEYCSKVIWRILPSFFIPLSVGIIISITFPESNLIRFFCNCSIITILQIVVVYLLCLSNNERTLIINFVKTKFKKHE